MQIKSVVATTNANVLYLATTAAVVPSEGKCELGLAQHAHSDTVIGDPDWCSCTDLDIVQIYFNLESINHAFHGHWTRVKLNNCCSPVTTLQKKSHDISYRTYMLKMYETINVIG